MCVYNVRVSRQALLSPQCFRPIFPATEPGVVQKGRYCVRAFDPSAATGVAITPMTELVVKVKAVFWVANNQRARDLIRDPTRSVTLNTSLGDV